jgi:hypothetical protein
MEQGADGLKLGTLRPDLMEAVIEEAKSHGGRTMVRLDPMDVARMNALDAARLGLTSMEHWYGLPEALLAKRTVQDFPLEYTYNEEQIRFAQAGRLWQQTVPPESDRWNNVMNELIELDFTLVPTFSIYEASRDLMRMRRAEWHEIYTLPLLWEFYGFGFIRELELLREAGLHPLEVIRVGGVVHTIKDGIIYDAKELLADVERMVEEAKRREGYEITQPGMKR